MIYRTLLCTIAVIFQYLPAQAEKPSVSEARSLLEAMGQSTIDFKRCGGDWGQITDAYVDFITACARSEADEKRMTRIYEASTEKRLDETQAMGFSCQGNVSEKLSVTLNAINSAISNCK